MTMTDRFDRDLASWLDGEAAMTPPAELHARAIERARGARQRPAWLVAARGGTFGAWPLVGRMDRRAVYLLAALALLLVAGLAAVVVGALRDSPIRPLGGNGPIVITFDSHNRGPGGILLVGADGTDLGPVSPGGRCPEFSADGRVMLAGNAADSSAPAIFTVTDPDSGSVSSVIGGPLDHFWHPHDGSFTVSPDGTRIAWLRSADPMSEEEQLELWVTRVADGSTTLVVPAPADPKVIYGLPAWSPDGRSLAFERWVRAEPIGYRSSIDVVDVDTAVLRSVTSRAGTEVRGLSWSPDGRFLAYSGLPDGATLPAAARDGPLPTDLTSPPDLPLDLFTIALDGSGERNVTSSEASETQPAWSPDGSGLAYLTAHEPDVTRLAIVAMEDGGPLGSPASGPDTEWFVWSPDGTRLLWLGTDRPAPTGGLSTVSSIDRGLLGPSTTVTAVEGQIRCPPAWRSVKPEEH